MIRLALQGIEEAAVRFANRGMNMIDRTLALAAALVPMFVTLSANEARAGGFQITELCAKCQGYRNAGAAASAREPATVYFNPAGISFLPFTEEKQNLVDLSTHIISGSFKFDDEDSRRAIQVTGPAPGDFVSPGGRAEGKRSDDGGEDGLVPNFYYARKLTDVVGFGLSVNVPYGLVTEYSDNWVGRYSSTKSDLMTININPAFSFKINEMFSFGFGLNMLYADVELKNALDMGTIVTAGGGAGVANLLGVSPSSLDSDGRVKLSGDDWGYGWNVGGLLNLNGGRTRLGVSYRSKVELTLDGHLRTRFPDQLKGVFGSSSKLDAEADLDLPATLNFGISHDVTPNWTLLAGAMWTEWEDFEEIKVKADLEDGGQGTIIEPQNWDNSWRYQLGTEYRPNSRLALRAGVEWDESPTPGKWRTTRVPDEDRFWLALGMTYQPRPDLSVDIAYTHIFIDDYDIDQQETFTEQAPGLLGSSVDSLNGVGNTTTGEYEAYANILSVGVRWQF